MGVIERAIRFRRPAQICPPDPDRAKKSQYRQQKGQGMGKGGCLGKGSTANHDKKAGINRKPCRSAEGEMRALGK
jgi:hypothetical protein